MGGKLVRQTGGLAVGVVGAVALVVATESRSARPPDRLSADTHAEYVKFPSGRDTITAYLAYPERKRPAPGGAPTPCRSPASVRRGSASTPRPTPASTPVWATWTRRSGLTTRPTATPYIPASATASCGPGKSRKSRILRGRRSWGSSGRVWNTRAAEGRS